MPNILCYKIRLLHNCFSKNVSFIERRSLQHERKGEYEIGVIVWDETDGRDHGNQRGGTGMDKRAVKTITTGLKCSVY